MYCGNDPVNLVDKWGLCKSGITGSFPFGTNYSSPEEAAKGWSRLYSEKSMTNRREYGSTIYEVIDKDGGEKYRFTEPNIAPLDDRERVRLSFPDDVKTVVGTIHSHYWKPELFKVIGDIALDHNIHNDGFSLKDPESFQYIEGGIQYAKKQVDAVILTHYVVTYSGKLFQFDRNNHDKPFIISTDFYTDKDYIRLHSEYDVLSPY